MQSTRFGLLAAALLGLAGNAAVGPFVVVAGDAPVATEQVAKQIQVRGSVERTIKSDGLAWLKGRPYSKHSGYPNGPGWTQAQVQRRARKARNVKANRRAQKRAGR